ncbi:ABC transporter permease [Rhodoplanes elegans]|uniref:ABC transporter permease n=1 Tax=Rhodoplanes elegans TaxID=29408 RepID=A0A327KKQ7_9BRAD|nr:ABC transporter permease [Rhodoplanes elegans]MBK5960418.1 ABC transporter permease [Rhodoplanes elegans]RAI38811.1 ABC transporter permease [Rhodoplanes elegans]
MSVNVLDADAASGRTRRRLAAANASLAQMAPDIALTLTIAVVVLAAWQYAPPLLGVPRYIIPTLGDCLAEFGRMVAQENLARHFFTTLWVSVVGFALGSAFGAAFGYALGLSAMWERAISPYLLTLQIAPKVAFAPLFIMWFGYTAWPKLLVTLLIVFFPILVNVLQSMKTVDRDLVNLARAYNMSRAAIFWKIEFPSSMPALMAGLRIGATLAVIGVTVGEFVGGNVGLGFLITYGEGQANTAMVFNAIILLTVIGIALYMAVAAIEKRVLHYIPRASH